MSFAAVGGNFTSLSITTSNVGDLICFEVDQCTGAAIYASALSSSRVTWTYVGTYYGSFSSYNSSHSLFIGHVNSVGSDTITVTWTGGTPTSIDYHGKEFSSTVGDWYVDNTSKVTGLDNGTGTWPRPIAASAGEVYFGANQNSTAAGSFTGTGYTSFANANSNPCVYSADYPGTTFSFSDANPTAGAAMLIGEGTRPTGIVVQVGVPGTAGITATGTLTGAWGSGQTRTAGNLLVAVVSVAAATASTTIPTPAGWTKVTEVNNGTYARVATFWKVATGSDSAWSATVTFTTGSASITQWELSGADTTAPIQTYGSGTATTGVCTATSTASVAADGSYGIAGFASEMASASAVYFTPNSTGYGAQGNGLYPASTSTSRGHEGFSDSPNLSSGATTSATGTFSGTQAYKVGLVVVVQPGSSDIRTVQVNSGANTGMTASVDVTLPAGVTQGNLVVMGIGVGNCPQDITPPAQWSIAGTTHGDTNNAQASIYYMVVDAQHAGETTWTVSFPGTSSAAWWVRELSSTAGWESSPVDVTNGNSGNNGTTVSIAGSGTTTQAEEVWFACLAESSNTAGISGLTTGWVLGRTGNNGSNWCGVSEFVQAPGATGAPNISGTLGSARSWGFANATFKTAGSSQNADITATAILATVSIPTPSVTYDASITATAISCSPAIPTATASGGSLVQAAYVATSCSLPPPGIIASTVKTATAVSATSSIPVPGIVAGVTKTAIAITATANIPTPGIVAGATKQATAVSATTNVPAITPSTSTVKQATAVSATAAIPAPTIAVQADAQITATAISATATVPAASAEAQASAAITTTAITVASSVPVPGFSSSVAKTATAVTATSTTPVPGFSSSVDKTASAVTATSAIGVPTITAGTGETVTSTAVTATTNVGSPAITAESNVSITPTAISATTAIPQPAIATNVARGYVGSGGSTAISGSWADLANAEGNSTGNYATWTAG